MVYKPAPASCLVIRLLSAAYGEVYAGKGESSSLLLALPRELRTVSPLSVYMYHSQIIKSDLHFLCKLGICFAEQYANSIDLHYFLAGFGVGEWVVLVNYIAVFLKPDHTLTL